MDGGLPLDSCRLGRMPVTVDSGQNTVQMNNIARQKLISELEHLTANKPVMGTLFITIAQTTDKSHD